MTSTSTFYIPLHIEKELELIEELTNTQAEKENEKKRLEIAEKVKLGIKPPKNPSFNEGFRLDSFYVGLYGEESFYSHILGLEQQIKNNGKRLSYAEINWSLENINNYKLHKNLSHELKQVRTAYTYFCLLAKNNVNPASDFDKHFKEIYSVIDRHAKGDIHAVHNYLMHLYNNYNYIAPEDILKALRKHLSPKQPIQKEENEMDNFDIQIAKILQKINQNPDKELEIINAEIKKLHNGKFNTLIYDYLTKRKLEIENNQSEDNLEKEIQSLFAATNANDELLA